MASALTDATTTDSPQQLVFSPSPTGSPTASTFAFAPAPGLSVHLRKRPIRAGSSISEETLVNVPTNGTESRGTRTGWRYPKRSWIPNPDLPRSRTIVLCFDGTGDQFDDDNSNIVQLIALLKKDDPSKQVVYYQTGIGTYTGPTVELPGLRTLSQTLDLMIASTLDSHVKDGYHFLMQNYTEGDKICIFGFSRGAYTARALAGMLQKVGLLPPHNVQQLPFAWHFYQREDPGGLNLARDFKETFSMHVKVELLGVFDTVSSVGLLPRFLPFTATNTSIRYFRHALSLDERRAKFIPNLYKNFERREDEARPHHPSFLHSHVAGVGIQTGKKRRVPTPLKSRTLKFEEEINEATGQETDSLEVWFAGGHADVGGGSVANNTRYSLARIPLRWMIRECFRLEIGIIFDVKKLRDIVGLDVDEKRGILLEPPPRLSPRTFLDPSGKPYTIQPNEPKKSFTIELLKALFELAAFPLVFASNVVSLLLPRRPVDEVAAAAAADALYNSSAPRAPFGGEDYEELRDALSPIYDQLDLTPGWWLLEWFPFRTKRQQAIENVSDRPEDYIRRQNLGRGRKVFKHIIERGMKVHRSVLTRLEALDAQGNPGGYVPQIRPEIVNEDGRRMCRRLTHEEWLAPDRCVGDTYEPWFEWVGDAEDEHR